MQKEAKGTLFICATPIGNMKDITIRVLNVLREADILVCEDTRRTLKLLNYYEIKPARLISYHQHSRMKRTEEILELLLQGANLALVTDAGMPGLSDPGADLISRAWEKGADVTVLPGASVVTAAIAVSGYPANRFVFLGFLDRLPASVRKKILRMNRYEDTIVLFESPHKIKETLKELNEYLGSCKVAVIRELTKKFEEIRHGSPADHLSYFSKVDPRGEFTLVIKPQPAKNDDFITDSFIMDKLFELSNAGVPSKYAVKAISLLFSVPRNKVYSLQLESHDKDHE